MRLYLLFDRIFALYSVIIVIRAIMSWFSSNNYNSFYRLLVKLTEPVLGRVRDMLPNFNGIDFSPMLVIILIEFGIRGYLLKLIFL